MPDYEPKFRDCYQSGFRDFHEGFPLEDNPYSEMNPEYANDWFEGWSAAQSAYTPED